MIIVLYTRLEKLEKTFCTHCNITALTKMRITPTEKCSLTKYDNVTLLWWL